MLAMSTPIRTSKVLLVADRRERASEPGAVAVRRFRLARLPMQRPGTAPLGPPCASSDSSAGVARKAAPLAGASSAKARHAR